MEVSPFTNTLRSVSNRAQHCWPIGLENKTNCPPPPNHSFAGHSHCFLKHKGLGQASKDFTGMFSIFGVIVGLCLGWNSPQSHTDFNGAFCFLRSVMMMIKVMTLTIWLHAEPCPGFYGYDSPMIPWGNPYYFNMTVSNMFCITGPVYL